jgi:hypothetical protein
MFVAIHRLTKIKAREGRNIIYIKNPPGIFIQVSESYMQVATRTAY